MNQCLYLTLQHIHPHEFRTLKSVKENTPTNITALNESKEGDWENIQ